MSNVIESEVVHNHPVPVIVFQLGWYMSGYIVIHLSEVLDIQPQSIDLYYMCLTKYH